MYGRHNDGYESYVMDTAYYLRIPVRNRRQDILKRGGYRRTSSLMLKKTDPFQSKSIIKRYQRLQEIVNCTKGNAV